MKSVCIVRGGLSALPLIASLSLADHEPQTEVLVPGVEQVPPIALTYGMRVVGGSINTPLDIDRFSFTAEAGDVVRIRIRTESTTLDPQCEVRNGNDVRVDIGWGIAGASGCTFEREFPVAAGPHLISLYDRNSDDAGDYTIQFERVPPRTTERVIGYDRPVSDTIDYRLDLDAFQVEMVAGTTMHIAVTTSLAGLDPDYALYDPAGDRVDNGWCSSGVTGCTVLRTVFPAVTGTYTLLVFDRNLDDSGDYEISLNCLSTSCPPFASELVRNGSGVNPLVYSVLSPAVLGGTLQLEIDASAFPAATAGSVFFYSAGGPGSHSPFGEILLNLGSTRIGRFRAPVLGGKATIALPIPADHALAGVFASSQGVISGASVHLTNAIDIVAGF